MRVHASSDTGLGTYDAPPYYPALRSTETDPSAEPDGNGEPTETQRTAPGGTEPRSDTEPPSEEKQDASKEPPQTDSAREVTRGAGIQPALWIALAFGSTYVATNFIERYFS